MRSGKIQVFGKPVPTVDENITHYIQGSGPKEKYMPSKLEDPSKRNHGMPFPLTAQTASNVGVLTTCSQCCNLRLIYSKHKLSGKQIASLKRLSNTFMYVVGLIFKTFHSTIVVQIQWLQKKFSLEEIFHASQI